MMQWMAKRDPRAPAAPHPYAKGRGWAGGQGVGGQEGDGGQRRCCPRALTLVVECVGQLMPHHHADTAEIKGSVGPWERAR